MPALADLGKLVGLMEHVRRNYHKRTETVESLVLGIESRSATLPDATPPEAGVESFLIDPEGGSCDRIVLQANTQTDPVAELVEHFVRELDMAQLLDSPAYVDGSSRLVRDIVYSIGVYASAHYQPDRALLAAYPTLGRTYSFELEDELAKAYAMAHQGLAQEGFSFEREVHFLSVNEDPSLPGSAQYAYTTPHIHIEGLQALGDPVHLPLYSYVGYNTGTMQDENRLMLELLAILDAARGSRNILVDGPVLVTPSLFNVLTRTASQTVGSRLIDAIRGLYTLSYALHTVYRWILGLRLLEGGGSLVGLVKRIERSTPLARALAGRVPRNIELSDESIIRLIVNRLSEVHGPLLIGPILTKIKIRDIIKSAVSAIEGFLEDVLGAGKAGSGKYWILCGGQMSVWTHTAHPQALLRGDALAVLALLAGGRLRVWGHARSPLCQIASGDMPPEAIMKAQYYLFIPDPHERRRGTILRVETPLYGCDPNSIRGALGTLKRAAARIAHETLAPRIDPVPHPLAVVDDTVKRITKTVAQELVRGLQGVLSLTYETIMSLQARGETVEA